MSSYIDYHHLTESNQIDNFIYRSLISAKWSLIFLCFMTGPISYIVPLSGLFIRTFIPDVYFRRIIGWGLVIWTYLNGMNSWGFLLLMGEILREFLRFGVPYIMERLGSEIPDDPTSETTARKLFRIIKVITQQTATASFQQVMLVGISHAQGDQSEKFSEDEKKKFQKFFKDFSKTSFIYDSDTSSITIFFPSFIIRFNNQGLQLTSDDAMKLIRQSDPTDDVCPICHEHYSDFSVELKCKHRYCRKCIFTWLNQQYTCPMCRSIVT
ncbi:hypothetical protein BH23THE1_BH23THE1_28360 [soil metagenome]